MATMIGLLALFVLVTGVIGWLWITVMAFSEGDTIWGVGCLILAPVCIVYGIMNFQELKVPLIMMIIGFIGRIGLGFVAAAMV